MDTFRRILVATDFSPCARAAVDHAALLAGRLGAAVDLLHVWEPAPRQTVDGAFASAATDEESLAEFARSKAGEAMERELARLEAAGLCVLGRVDGGRVIDTIVRVADAYDLVVLGTHGRTGFARILLGSVAEEVVRRARPPVLTVRLSADALAQEDLGR